MQGPGPARSESPAPKFPSMLEGIVSPEEYQKYTAFQEHLNANPEIRQLNAQILELVREERRLRAEANALREKLMAANPEIMAIRAKFAALTVPGGGPPVSPVPVKTR